MFQIDKNVPLPERTEAGKKAVYPFGGMEIGDSVLVPLNIADRVSDALVKWKVRHPGWDYATRRSAEGMRVWRMS